MIQMLLRVLIFLGSAAIGLLVAWLILDQFELSVSGFITAVLVFAIAQSVLSPFILKMASRYAPAFVGGVGLISTFVALLIASWFPGGLTISGIATWVLATLIVWLVTALCTWLLPLTLLKKHANDSR